MDKQLTLTQLQTPIRSCAFTGHRELYEGFSKRKLTLAIKRLIENGVEVFYNGMAMGFDLLAAETVLSYQKKYPNVKLIACIPCYNQEKSFSEADKKRYAEILKKASEQVLLSENYYRGCMQVRDQYMVDNADMLLCYCVKETGGAAYTVKYCQKKYPLKPILEI
ncbi:MAG: DUF1273 family protein [Clostridia bacterium]|nr:DUF1273 family protein [Clostridia bacterium]